MAASAHWVCTVQRHPGGRPGEHGVRTGCPVAAGHNPNAGPRDCYTCKQAATKRYRGETKQRADKEHFACTLMPWEHDPPNLMGSMGGHREGCAVLPGHAATPGKGCVQCRRRYAGLEGLSPAEFATHPHYACSVPVLEHIIKPRVGRGHRPGCQVAKGHDAGKGPGSCHQCWLDTDGPAYSRAHGLRKRYGLSSADYETMLARQGGACAICGRKERGG